MSLPAQIFTIKFLGWTQGLILFSLGLREIRKLSRSDVAHSHHLASSGLLLIYRVAMLILCLSIGLHQLYDKGPVVWVFFTVWNWNLLTAYFALASAASLREYRISNRLDSATADSAADFIDKAAATIFHIIVPITVSIDIITWTVLVPLLMQDPNPANLEKWKSLMFCFTSYMQHGGNAVMILGDMALNRIPLLFLWGKGVYTIWISLFGVWSAIFFAKTGRFIYPFLDMHKPNAWITYVGVYIGNTVLFLMFVAAMKSKDAILNKRRDSNQRKSKKAQTKKE